MNLVPGMATEILAAAREDKNHLAIARLLACYGPTETMLIGQINLSTLKGMASLSIQAYSKERCFLDEESDAIVALLISRGVVSFQEGSKRQSMKMVGLGNGRAFNVRHGQVTEVFPQDYPWKVNPNILDALSESEVQRINNFEARSKTFKKCAPGFAVAAIMLASS